MKRWKFGLIGCGGISEFHLSAIRELPNAELAMISDRKRERAAEIGGRESSAYTTDYAELLARSDIDVVCVTTSSGTHATIGSDVLRAGKHLFLEKPMAMTAEAAERMNRLAEDAGLTIGVVSQRRFEEQHMHAYRALKEGRIGKLLLIEAGCPFYRTQAYYDSAAWRGTVEHDGGAMMNQGIHSLDLMLWMGGGVRTVYAKKSTQTHKMEAEDIGVAILEFDNGAYGNYVASTSFPPGFPPYLHLYGEHGTIKVQGDSITHWTVPGMPEPELPENRTAGGGAANPLAISHAYHREQMAEFLEALESGRTPSVSGRDGWNAVRVVEAMYRSAKEGREVRL